MTPDLALHEIEPQRRALVAEDAITRSRQDWQREHRRPPALTAREALAALRFDVTIVLIVASDVRKGKTPSDDDWRDLLGAISRIAFVADEVCG